MTVAPSAFDRVDNDLYETPAWATECLLRHIDVAGSYAHEPACGNRAISDVLEKAGAQVLSTDKYAYGDDSRDHEIDFLKKRAHRLVRKPFDFIVTNPPYGKQNRTAIQFIERALEWTEFSQSTVAMLLPAKIDFGSTRYHIFGDCPAFKMIIKLTDRIQWFEPSIERCDAKGNTAGSTEDHAWFVWDWTNDSPPVTFYEGMSAEAKAEIKAKKAAVKRAYLEESA